MPGPFARGREGKPSRHGEETGDGGGDTGLFTERMAWGPRNPMASTGTGCQGSRRLSRSRGLSRVEGGDRLPPHTEDLALEVDRLSNAPQAYAWGVSCDVVPYVPRGRPFIDARGATMVAFGGTVNEYIAGEDGRMSSHDSRAIGLPGVSGV